MGILLDDCLSFSRSLAKEIGLNNSIFLQDIAYWVNHNQSQNTAYEDGRYWTFSTYEKLCERHPYWTRRQLQKIIKDCKEAGWLLVGAFNKNRYDHTNWYTISDKLIALCSTIDCTQMLHRSNENVTSDGTQNVTSIKIINKDVSKNIINKNIPCDSAGEEDFDVFWAAYPRKQNKATARKAFAKVKVSLETLLDAIEKHKQTEQWRKDGGKFIPYPASWLNAGAWEDELDIVDEKYNQGQWSEDDFFLGGGK